MFVAFSKVFTPENLLYFAKGAVVSLLLAAVSLLFGIVFGILGSSAKRSKYKIFRIIGNVYVEVIRGTPMLLQILILFSVIPSIYTAFTGNVLRINVFLIGAVELLKSAQVVGAQYYDVMSPYCIVAVYYLIMTISISYLGRYVEKRLAESD